MKPALLFDFDGLILDTETPVFESWRAAYRDHGLELPVEDWLAKIGTADDSFDPLARLRGLLAEPLDEDALERTRRQRRDTRLHAEEVLPGVVDWLEHASSRGHALAVVSSSPLEWVEQHGGRLGLLHYFEALVTRDLVRRAKPHPELYERALTTLGVRAAEAIAIEDSPNGIAAAKAAGIYTIAVPGAMTRGLDVSRADRVLHSLGATSLADVLLEFAAD